MAPLPFSKGAIVWDGPHLAPRTSDTGQLGQITDAWGEALNAANARAEALVE